MRRNSLQQAANYALSHRHPALRSSLRRIAIGASFFVLTAIVAIVGYRLAGWSLLDAIYMVTITVFGVGYGEVNPVNTPALKIFTMFTIVAGTSSAVYTVGGFIQLIAEGEIRQVMEARRMSQDIELLRQHTIVCGYGRIGQILARRLAQARQDFITIDADPARVAMAEERGFLALCGSAADEGLLLAAGILRARVLATVLPDDATNVFITLTARELNPNLVIIARGESPSTEKKLKLAGADRVVLPAAIGAERIAHAITHPAALDFLQDEEGRENLNELLAQIDIRLDELTIAADSPFANRAIGDMEVRGKGAFIVIAVRTEEGQIIIHPGHDFVLMPGQTAIVMGHQGDIPQFAQRYALRREMRYRGASW